MNGAYYMFNYQLLITLELSPKSLGELPICPFTLLPIHPSTHLLAYKAPFCAFWWLKNPRNLRNPRLINDLRAYQSLYICKETFTDVMSALQIKLFLQNEPKFRKSQMNVNKVLTKNYDKKDTWSIGKNEPKTNPTCRGVASWRSRKQTQLVAA
jgi:hypothetical protein